MLDALFPYQREGVASLYNILYKENLPIAFNASEMGLGKTAMSIALMLEILKVDGDAQFIIVCPAYLIRNWKEELVRWTGETLGNHNVTCVSYSIIARGKIPSGSYALLVADETHNLKNGFSKTYQYFSLINTEKILFLSGTQITKSATDLFPIYSKAFPSNPESLDFQRFCDEIANLRVITMRTKWGKEITRNKYYGCKNPAMVDKLKPHTIRYVKAAVAKQLPAKIYQDVELPIKVSAATKGLVKLTPKERQAIERMLESGDGGQNELVPLRRKIALLKAPHMIDYICNIAEDNEGQSIVVFGWFREFVENICTGLNKKLGTGTARTSDGSIPAAQRAALVTDFQAGRFQIVVATIASLGVGVTLTKASTCIMGDYSWLPNENDQAVDRLHRIGQQSTVHVIRTISSDMDRILINCWRNRGAIASQILDRQLGQG
jgi:SNF2 family DNA or RNA helicase